MKEKDIPISTGATSETVKFSPPKDAFVHETAIIDDGVRIGKATKICSRSRPDGRQSGGANGLGLCLR
jgi:hypothetical protein